MKITEDQERSGLTRRARRAPVVERARRVCPQDTTITGTTVADTHLGNTIYSSSKYLLLVKYEYLQQLMT